MSVIVIAFKFVTCVAILAFAVVYLWRFVKSEIRIAKKTHYFAAAGLVLTAAALSLDVKSIWTSASWADRAVTLLSLPLFIYVGSIGYGLISSVDAGGAKTQQPRPQAPQDSKP